MPKQYHKLSEVKDGAIHLKIIYTVAIMKRRKRIKKLSVASVIDYGFPDLFYFDHNSKQFYTRSIKSDNNSLMLVRNYLNNTYVSELVKQNLIREIDA